MLAILTDLKQALPRNRLTLRVGYQCRVWWAALERSRRQVVASGSGTSIEQAVDEAVRQFLRDSSGRGQPA